MISSNSLSLLTIITLFITVLVQSEDLTELVMTPKLMDEMKTQQTTTEMTIKYNMNHNTSSTPKENQTRPLKRVNHRRRGKNIKRNTSGFQLIESSCQKLNNLER
ncbi:unnamed protein product [Schistosoma turkestanicum]|nr:unnamed protein product [Schistosoma turkestanicum]